LPQVLINCKRASAARLRVAFVNLAINV
jgi:hypothetical protein